MTTVSPNPEAKRTTFDSLAPRWDSFKPEGAFATGADRGLALLGPLSGLDIVDLGCGTGRLELLLLPRLGDGSVTGVDFSPAMIEQASTRCADPRARWLCRDVLETGLPSALTDIVLCFDSFPHFPDRAAALGEIWRWLRPGGRFLLWHDIGRDQLADVHRRAGPPVDADVLPPVEVLARLAEAAGFLIECAEEDQESYTLLARRPS
ncbi:MAG: class I SAM-dependent methyltransferase [Acidobacteria bacterium]|nr:class I SAM-dependent methyltransferase [Acidobacteriota bacterium]MCG3191150.1 Ubiquinone/menaquinone biosynthesis C-methyltransferase UbiE [Thermoanaerobaculia bacterium]